jgi:hypothetical protein
MNEYREISSFPEGAWSYQSISSAFFFAGHYRNSKERIVEMKYGNKEGQT